MAVNKDEILDAISKMTLLEVMELVSDMEKKFGVTAAAPVAVAAAPELAQVRLLRRGWRAGGSIPGRRCA